MVENQTQEIVGQKRRAFLDTSSASEEMVAVGGTRRSKRVKVAPTRYIQAEEESLEASPLDSSGVVIRNIILATSPLDESSEPADGEITPMNGSNEDADNDSSQRVLAVSAVAAATRVNKRSKGKKTFDERFKDLMSFKAEFGHCNVPRTKSRNNKHLSLGVWCCDVRHSYRAIKMGRSPSHKLKLSKANIQCLENAGFEWSLS